MVLDSILLMRPRQWVKNVFVFAPLIFSGHFLDGKSVFMSLAVFVLFCLASSVVYILNDIRDIDHDRQHPVKSRQRPLAAGKLSVNFAYILFAVLLVFVLLVSFLLYPPLCGVISIYITMNAAYSIWLKHQPVVDIFIIALGFMLRVYAGAVTIFVPVSQWMFVTTFCLALYLAAVKRQQEVRLVGKNARKVLEHYNEALVDRFAQTAGTAALVFYGLFVINLRPEMIWTIPIVMYGLFRYWFIVENYDAGESPTDALLKDWQLQVTVLGWVGFCIYQLWPHSTG